MHCVDGQRQYAEPCRWSHLMKCLKASYKRGAGSDDIVDKQYMPPVKSLGIAYMEYSVGVEPSLVGIAPGLCAVSVGCFEAVLNRD